MALDPWLAPGPSLLSYICIPAMILVQTTLDVQGYRVPARSRALECSALVHSSSPKRSPRDPRTRRLPLPA